MRSDEELRLRRGVSALLRDLWEQLRMQEVFWLLDSDELRWTWIVEHCQVREELQRAVGSIPCEDGAIERRILELERTARVLPALRDPPRWQRHRWQQHRPSLRGGHRQPGGATRGGRRHARSPLAQLVEDDARQVKQASPGRGSCRRRPWCMACHRGAAHRGNRVRGRAAAPP